MCEMLRLDIVLKTKYNLSRTKAKELIESGLVLVDGKKVLKTATPVFEGARIEICDSDILKYVSRGGLKLEKAITSFKIDLVGRVCMDIGASTGGFTDCMLEKGAEKVFAVDVGHNQLAPKLAKDARVISMENTNIKDVAKADIFEDVEFISIDVSFISLEKILPSVGALLAEGGEVVALIKPQFEVGKSNIGKSGVVKGAKLHKMAINNVIDFAKTIGLYTQDIDYSPIKGGNGNIEYLIYLKRDLLMFDKNKVDECINSAHKGL